MLAFLIAFFFFSTSLTKFIIPTRSIILAKVSVSTITVKFKDTGINILNITVVNYLVLARAILSAFLLLAWKIPTRKELKSKRVDLANGIVLGVGVQINIPTPKP
jgi:hypothetical protein